MNDLFRRFSHRVSELVGSPWAFLLALLTIIVWLITGPVFHYSDTWQLIINTGTTIITFLMVFLIQNTQNRDSRAVHLKLDELIRTNAEARNLLIDSEDLSDEEVREIQKAFQHLHASDSERVKGFVQTLMKNLEERN